MTEIEKDGQYNSGQATLISKINSARGKSKFDAIDLSWEVCIGCLSVC